MDFSAESKLESSEGSGDPPQRHPADEEEVDVAGSTVFRASGRAIDERGDKVLGHGLQGGAEARNDAADLCEEGGEFRQEGAVGVRLEVDTIPVLSTPEDSCTSEPFDVALQAEEHSEVNRSIDFSSLHARLMSSWPSADAPLALKSLKAARFDGRTDAYAGALSSARRGFW